MKPTVETRSSVHDPFDDHEGHEVAEEGPEEDNSRQELDQNLAVLLEVNVVE